MKDDFKNTVKVACIYITTIIGAGFASGQEIASFFSTYYTGGFFGIILSGILFSAIGVLVLDRVYRERITGYNELLLSLVGKRLASVMEVIVTLFMLSLFIIMVSGMGSVIKEETGIGFFPASAAMCFLCYLVIVTNIRGIVAVSTALTPLLIAGMAVTGLYVILFKDLQAGGNGFILERVMDNWFLSSLTYVSYNSIMSIVMMSSLLPYLKSRKTGVAGGIIGGAVLCLIAMIINTAIFLFYPDILSKELPMLDITGKYSINLKRGYTFILWTAMFTSAVTSGYCFVERIRSRVKLGFKSLALFVCFMAIPLSGLGFSNLIGTVYPIFGYAGMVIVMGVLVNGIIKRPSQLNGSKKQKTG